MKKDKKKVVFLSSIILLFLCVIGVGIFLLTKSKEPEKVSQPDLDPIEIEEPALEEQEEVYESPIDFAHWKSVNDDVYAWIRIADTNIDYPILQHETDDSYYLEHTIDGVEGYPGSIYTEKVNAKDFSDFNTLIYGHDMRDGSMFKHLHKFEDYEFFETHDTVLIYTETETKSYRVYAAVIYDNRHIMYTYDNDNMEDRTAFIQSLKEIGGKGSYFREGMTIDENSKLITMSTCITGQPDKRYIVLAEEIVDS